MTAQLNPALDLKEAIAPPERRGLARDGVRLLVSDRSAGMHHHARFFDLPRLVRSGDLFVVNDSATLPARLCARRANGENIALHLSSAIDEWLWSVEPRSPVHVSEELSLDAGGRVRMLAPAAGGSGRLWYASFDLPLAVTAFLSKYGEPIRYRYVRERFPLSDYQTIFARKPGSAEMPSAARPFTARTLRELRAAGASVAAITLHCGVSSLEAPERPAAERFSVSPASAHAIRAARARGSRVIAVGTTVVRALESAVYRGDVVASNGWTGLVIGPDHRAQAVDAVITGFHEAAATHVDMLRAFAGEKTLSQAYELAAQEGYRKHEFGDIHALL